jgi:glycosyltransferase involved in cell wall biosynthesis
MACLYECPHKSARNLGLRLLFELLNDETRSNQISEIYSFSHADFIGLTDKFDVYELRRLTELTQTVDAFQRDRLYRLIHILRSEQALGQRLRQALWIAGSMLVPRSVKRHIFPLVRRIAPGGEGPRRLLAPEPYAVRQPSAPQADRPKVVHAIANFMMGGSSRLVIDLIEQMGGEYEQEVVTGFLPSPPAYVGLAIREFRYLDSPKPLLAYLSKFRPRLLHVHYWGDANPPWYRWVFEAGRQYGCTIVENVNTPVAPFVADWVHRYVFVSEYVLREFGRSLLHGEVIHPGSNLELFSRVPGAQPADDCIGMVYRLEPDKLNERVIDVFIETVRRRPRTRVLIGGGGSLQAGFQRAVAEAGLDAAFEFTGYVRYEDLPALYGRMSVFVAPVWQESFGQVSPFAMSMGLPVVGYEVGALAEIIADRELLAPPGDSSALAAIIVRLLDNRNRRIEIGCANRRRAYEMFSVDSMIRCYRQLYRELMKPSP